MNMPRQQEIKMLKAAEREHTLDENNVWDAAEYFIFALIGVPQFQLRLEAWEFENSFQERFDLMSETERDVSKGLDIICTSESVRHLLGICLYVGNYLNGGTARGRADGFALDTLLQM